MSARCHAAVVARPRVAGLGIMSRRDGCVLFRVLSRLDNDKGTMIDAAKASYAALLLRLSLGVLFLMHGLYLKVFMFGMAGVSEGFASMGLPAWFAWVVMLYETIGGIMLILGLYVPLVAAFLGIHMLAATFIGHAANGWLFTNQGGGYEFPLFWAIVCFALALLGAGAYALMPSRSRAAA